MIITKREWTCSLLLLWNTITWRLWQKHSSYLRKKNKFNQENFCNNAPIRRGAIAMNTKSAFTGFFSENRFWCHLYVTTLKAMNFQDGIPSIPMDDFKDHYVLVFDLTSIQDDTENCQYTELVGEPLRLELIFTDALENVIELIVLVERMSSAAIDKFGVVGKNV